MTAEVLTRPPDIEEHVPQADMPPHPTLEEQAIQNGLGEQYNIVLDQIVTGSLPKRISYFLTALNVSPNDRSDYCQEIMLRLLQNPKYVDVETSAVSFGRIAINYVIDKKRRRENTELVVDFNNGSEIRYLAELADRAIPLGSLVVDRMAMTSELRQLSDDQARLLLHIYYEGKTVVQAAQELGLPLGTAKSMVYRALKRLRQNMKTTPDQSP